MTTVIANDSSEDSCSISISYDYDARQPATKFPGFYERNCITPIFFC
jgi:hypothetical protein